MVISAPNLHLECHSESHLYRVPVQGSSNPVVDKSFRTDVFWDSGIQVNFAAKIFAIL